MAQRGYSFNKSSVAALREFDRKLAYDLKAQILNESSIIQPNGRYITISTNTSDLVLSSNPCITSGVNGQILTLFNIGQYSINLKFGLATSVIILAGGTIELIYLTTLSKWFITNFSSRYIDANAISSGVVPIQFGGTGSSEQNFVDLSTNQTINGNKTFSGTTNAVTAAYQTNTNSIATTAFVSNSNRPFVRVFLNNAVENISGELTMPWNFKEKDRDNAWNLSTHTFTAPLEGVYLFIVTAFIKKTGTAASTFAIHLVVNDGAAYYRVAESQNHNTGILSGSYGVYLLANARVKFSVTNHGSQVNYTLGAPSDANTSLTIARLNVI